MKNLVLFIFALTIINLYAGYAQNIECEKADKEVCGYDSWECSAQKCFIQNEDNLEQAFKLYFQYLIQEQKQITKKYNKKKNLFLQLYQKIQEFPLPKIDESFKFEHGLQGFNNDEPFCKYKIKRIANDLNIEFNACQEESHIIIFQQQNNGFSIIYKIEIL